MGLKFDEESGEILRNFIEEEEEVDHVRSIFGIPSHSICMIVQSSFDLLSLAAFFYIVLRIPSVMI